MDWMKSEGFRSLATSLANEAINVASNPIRWELTYEVMNACTEASMTTSSGVFLAMVGVIELTKLVLESRRQECRHIEAMGEQSLKSKHIDLEMRRVDVSFEIAKIELEREKLRAHLSA